MGLFGSKRPPPVATDHVIPFRFADDFPYTRGLCLDISLRFDDVLDSDKLRDALDVLLNKPGWRKLGARLRLNVRLFNCHNSTKRISYLTREKETQ